MICYSIKSEDAFRIYFKEIPLIRTIILDLALLYSLHQTVNLIA